MVTMVIHFNYKFRNHGDYRTPRPSGLPVCVMLQTMAKLQLSSILIGSRSDHRSAVASIVGYTTTRVFFKSFGHKWIVYNFIGIFKALKSQPSAMSTFDSIEFYLRVTHFSSKLHNEIRHYVYQRNNNNNKKKTTTVIHH